MSTHSHPEEDVYVEVRLQVSPIWREPLLEALWEMDTLGCEETEHSDRCFLTAFFPAFEKTDRLSKEILARCKRLGFQPSELSLQVVHFSSKEWLERCLEHFRAFGIGDKCFIHPSWESPSPAHLVNILLEPGHGFGTGTHESTQLSLLALESTVSQIASFLDIGTGSGILTIAARKLNPELNVFALDIDLLAIRAAQENFHKNQVSGVRLIGGETYAVASDFDLVVGNLTASIIRNLEQELSRLARRFLILSGFTIEQGPELLTRFEPAFELIQQYSQNEWVCYKLKRCRGS